MRFDAVAAAFEFSKADWGHGRYLWNICPVVPEWWFG